mmetsp:Transcript_20397/g.60928  ORF Transcript_20397/g.60928 Transcript_20397/m.60928 type:complete len:234 (+) Transcript_20397:3619-4320(+)
MYWKPDSRCRMGNSSASSQLSPWNPEPAQLHVNEPSNASPSTAAPWAHPHPSGPFAATSVSAGTDANAQLSSVEYRPVRSVAVSSYVALYCAVGETKSEPVAVSMRTSPPGGVISRPLLMTRKSENEMVPWPFVKKRWLMAAWSWGLRAEADGAFSRYVLFIAINGGRPSSVSGCPSSSNRKMTDDRLSSSSSAPSTTVYCQCITVISPVPSELAVSVAMMSRPKMLPTADGA